VPQLEGSYEEMPANIIDYAKRDRRWSQGNLQHGRVLGLPGLKTMSRLHLFMGVTSYLMSPLWLLLLALSTADAIERAVVAPVYWKPGFNLFPKWPISPDFQIHLLLAITLGTLFLPKLLGLLLVVFDRAKRRAFGGLGALLASVLLETVFSTLVAPVMMLFQTVFVGATLAGRVVQWDPQPRDDRGVSWREAFSRHAGQTMLSAVWGALVLWIVPGFIYWLLPILTGLLTAIPVSVWSSRIGWGRAAGRAGLFLTPEETRPASELRAVRSALAEGPDLVHGSAVDPATLVPSESGIEMRHLDWNDRHAAA
jgi:membrane glycosyltransferase